MLAMLYLNKQVNITISKNHAGAANIISCIITIYRYNDTVLNRYIPEISLVCESRKVTVDTILK